MCGTGWDLSSRRENKEDGTREETVECEVSALGGGRKEPNPLESKRKGRKKSPKSGRQAESGVKGKAKTKAQSRKASEESEREQHSNRHN